MGRSMVVVGCESKRFSRRLVFVLPGTAGDRWGILEGGMIGEEMERSADTFKAVDWVSTSRKGWPFVEMRRDEGEDGEPISPTLEGCDPTNPSTNLLPFDSSTDGGRGGESMPRVEGFHSEGLEFLLREGPYIEPTSGLLRWRLPCEPAAGWRVGRGGGRSLWRECPLACKLCFGSRWETIPRYTLCLLRKP